MPNNFCTDFQDFQQERQPNRPSHILELFQTAILSKRMSTSCQLLLFPVIRPVGRTLWSCYKKNRTATWPWVHNESCGYLRQVPLSPWHPHSTEVSVGVCMCTWAWLAEFAQHTLGTSESCTWQLQSFWTLMRGAQSYLMLKLFFRMHHFIMISHYSVSSLMISSPPTNLLSCTRKCERERACARARQT